MAALNLSPSSNLPLFSNVSSRYAPSISFYSLPKPAVLFSSITLRRKTFSRNRNPRAIVSAIKKLSETDLVAIPSDDSITGILPSDSGVYAVYGGGGDIQFIGITRNLAASVLGHKKSVPELCSSVKVGLVEGPDKISLTEAWKSWMEEHIAATGKVPVGNEPGNSTWVKKSSKKKSDLRLTPGRHVQLTVPLEDLIDRLVKENKVVAFIKGSRSAPLCGFSQRVVAILESQGVDYESIDVLDEEYNYGLRETLKKYSNWPTFPQIFVDGELVGGCDILTSMYEKGELSGLFK
ncbi:bifunctional monothiol glutaredoxin-S16, chloroplastic [Primulina huaijiensis]|uniref:bifunctional monothiol glutaredoxin-S16, chloroplastic n=1 Tax=Primulina huaijiensis TaxID=1492673 RepID=UPI003CC73731